MYSQERIEIASKFPGVPLKIAGRRMFLPSQKDPKSYHNMGIVFGS